MNESIVAEDQSTISSPPLLHFRELLDGYRGRSGCFDEAVDELGQLRPGWRTLFDKLGGLTTLEIERRVAQAQRQMNVDGVAFNPHDARNITRPWSLDPIPLVIEQQAWQRVAEGLQQRARLADLVLLDLLGPQTMLHERILPPEVLFAHPRYYPSYHSLVPRPNKHLHLYAADLARQEDGQWCVTSDRTRTPFGLGYLLENRLITSRMLPAAFESCHVQRLAPFFMTLQNTMRSLAGSRQENPRIALWTKGPTSRAYFEDAFLARYLGYTLVEGDDLAVRGNRVMLKTLGGLLPIEVLMRRVEDHACDPAELAGESTHGIAGLLEVVRSGRVAISNSIGSCLSESPMLMAYMPSICRHLLNEDLLLPSLPTWWCGDPSSLTYVLEHFDELVIRQAFRREDEAPFHPAQMSKGEKSALRDRVRANPVQYVGQEMVNRSTAPVWEQGRLHAWSLALRAFLIARGDQYEAVPGGLARVAPDPRVLIHNMTSGEKSQDVWILAEERVEAVSLLKATSGEVELTRGGSELPSRAADNLFWMGRNLERAEQIVRLVRVALQHITSQEDAQETLRPLLDACAKAKQVELCDADRQPPIDIERFVRQLAEGMMSFTNPHSLRSVVAAAEFTALKARDRIALDQLRIVRDLKSLLDVQLSTADISPPELMAVMDQLVILLNALSGLAGENMTRTLGWRFLDMGRRLERAHQTASTLALLLPLQRGEIELVRRLEFCLQIHDSFMTYRNRYLANFQLAAVLDLLIVDGTNPRSILFQLNTACKHVDRLPRSEQSATLSNEQRLATALTNAVKLADVSEICALDNRGELAALHKLLNRISDQIPKLSDSISARFLIHAGFQRHYATQSAVDVSATKPTERGTS